MIQHRTEPEAQAHRSGRRSNLHDRPRLHLQKWQRTPRSAGSRPTSPLTALTRRPARSRESRPTLREGRLWATPSEGPSSLRGGIDLRSDDVKDDVERSTDVRLGSLPAFVFACSIAYPSAARAGAIAWRTSFDSIRFACVTVESISGRVAAKTSTSGYTHDGGFVELGKKRQRG